MKKLFCALALIGTTSLFADDHPYAKINVLSDFDDTIKQTDSASKLNAAWRVPFYTKTFAGSDELLRSMIAPSKELLVVSATPSIFRKNIEKTLDDNHFPSYKLYLRKKGDGNTKQFKLKMLHKVIAESSDSFILMGDDTQYDPEVMLQMKKEFPDKVIAIYIHSIVGKEIVPGTKGFITPYEVAFEESKAGRLDKDTLLRVEESILGAKEKRIVAPYASCGRFADLKDKMSPAIVSKLNELCAKKEKNK